MEPSQSSPDQPGDRAQQPAANEPAPIAPVCPGDDECCLSGCDPCVFDRYAEELERYRAALRRWEQRTGRAAP